MKKYRAKVKNITDKTNVTNNEKKVSEDAKRLMIDFSLRLKIAFI
ncbi:hypothetical protein Dfri01_58490 [Dyadobacter frigoris]|nr:hypothetical protein Dfri01_58490 [Dyadobacter frigoris]